MIMVMGLRIMKPITVPSTDKNNMAIMFTCKSHWVTSNPLTLKFRTKLIRYE
ncbi:hypothetical protein Hanom_Chr17g01566201 [Helianthus anomalus]